jgi:peptidoglycan/xylan/chitin deacetylase (PgdA/CDA1 family)
MAMPALAFAAQMSFLARRRNVISLDALAGMLARGETPEQGSVVITFDDGYLDNYEIAAPILSRHGLPATVFIATGYIGRAENMWVDVLHAAFKGRSRQSLELLGGSFDLANPIQLDQAYSSASAALVQASRSERGELMASIRDQLQAEQPKLRSMMGWPEVRELRQRYPEITIGSHTREHFDLSSMPDDEVVEELGSAHQDIRRELGVDPIHFAFPYGRDNGHARAWLKSNGYRTASLTEPLSLVQNSSNPLALTRLGATQDASPGRFAYHTSGAHPSLSQALFLGKA